MAFLNPKNKEVQVKIVYYGPGRGGKTTNLEYINNKYKHRIMTDMVSLKTHGDRTLFFDFLPLDIGRIKGYEIKIQLYTVPGQVKYNQTRKLVLKGVDGIVFVADVIPEQREKNIESLNNLNENLAAYNLDVFNFPLVLQYNKMDLKSSGRQVLSNDTMQKDLNSRLQAPAFEASALTGGNVVPALKQIIMLSMASVQQKLS